MALRLIPSHETSDAFRVECAIKALSLTSQLKVIRSVVEAADFADFDDDTLDRLDTALTALLSQSLDDDQAESVRLHGRDVAA